MLSEADLKEKGDVLFASSALVAVTFVAGISLWTYLETRQTGAPPPKRPEHIVALSIDADDLPPRTDAPTLLLMGNSHTYALPGLHRGEGLRNDVGGTLIDELAQQVSQRVPPPAPRFVRASSPNLLPFEMLTWFSHLVQQGLHPKVVVVGITFRNVARDRVLRPSIRALYRNEALADAVRGQLSEGSEEIAQSISAARREEARADAMEMERSWADRADERIQKSIAPYFPLIGESAWLRSVFYREFAYAVEAIFLGDQAATHGYALVEEDLAFNQKCLHELFRTVKSTGSALLVYLAPERSDLPLLMDSERQKSFNQWLILEAESLGGTLVDARNVVEPRFWGWERNTPDRSHFTEPGHKALASTLVENPSTQQVWQTLQAR